jgi:hypothetical protein
VKLLSLPHVRKLLQGVGAFTVKKHTRWCFPMPNPSQFDGRCLPIAIIVGYLFNKNQSIYGEIRKHHNSRAKDAQEKSSECLEAYFRHTVLKCGIPSQGEYPVIDTIKCMADYFNVQVWILRRDREQIVESKWPENTELSRPQIFLYLDEVYGRNHVSTHVDFITDIKSFLRQSGARALCIGCGHVVLSHSFTHRCQKVDSCFGCHRILAKSDSFSNANDVSLTLCDAKITDTLSVICDLCNVICGSYTCLLSHKSRVCNLNYKCISCGSYMTCQGKLQNRQALKDHHNCGYTQCNVCYEQILSGTRDHACKMSVPKLPTKYQGRDS